VQARRIVLLDDEPVARHPASLARVAPAILGGVTPAILALDAAGVAYSVHEYDHDGSIHDFGLEAAAKLGLDPDQVFKTLVVTADADLAVAIVPVSGKLSLKAVGRAIGAKRIEMCDPAVAERVTGYVRGGISPFGQKKSLPTVIDEMATVHDIIYVSGGRRGLDLAVAPSDLIELLDATVADIAAP
jgi:Cys-tRNA(Pro)/Cys-tRNA(Cys) deacylase